VRLLKAEKNQMLKENPVHSGVLMPKIKPKKEIPKQVRDDKKTQWNRHVMLNLFAKGKDEV